MNKQDSTPKHFTKFETDINGIDLPPKFNFPFYYEPHELAKLAAKQLQRYIAKQSPNWNHNFGLDPNKKGLVIGKMFGVLVVKNQEGELGFLSAFSGKLAESNHHDGFVPPLFDMLEKDGFFQKEEVILNSMNAHLELLESNEDYLSLKAFLEKEKELSVQQLTTQKERLNIAKRERKKEKEEALKNESSDTLEVLLERQKTESLSHKSYFKTLQRHWATRLTLRTFQLDRFQREIDLLKKERKERSNALQQKLFDQYHFLDKDQITKSVIDIFKSTPLQVPPAGSGECAAPKLVQYAHQHQLTPITMAEFWWGTPPPSAVRKHGHYYPACRSKCEPILGYMLRGIPMDKNPFIKQEHRDIEIPIIYEDDELLIINKPPEFLSVPGKILANSVHNVFKAKYPDASSMLVHRLDMSTSGIMILTKNNIANKHLQRQFLKRTIKKRYVAILDGFLEKEKGEVNLPLRLDIDNRPHQLVCYEHGKNALTRWEVIERNKQFTRVYFYPVTGRTHQLRVHAAHPKGLNLAIKGDDLYGIKKDRLYLHAERITFIHPTTREEMTIQVSPEF